MARDWSKSSARAEGPLRDVASGPFFPKIPRVKHKKYGRRCKQISGKRRGEYYVDEQCIDCDLCRETAPANFKRNYDVGHSYVYKQAETPEEEAVCKEAMEGCPVEAIGNDG
jgi:ferredoxin